MRAALIGVGLLVSLEALPAPQTPGFDLDGTVEAELKARGTPGGAVAVIADGRVILLKAYGVRNVESSERVTTDTLFRIGSTTKMLTAAAVVTLAAQGKLRLDAPVGRSLEGLDPSIARLSSHDLLRQASGLRDFAPLVRSSDDEALGRNVRAWKADAFFTEPGEVYSYSSPGYWLAGYVAEAVHGKPYPDTMRELLFEPLGMSRSTVRPLVAATYDLALPHEVSEGRAAVVRPLPDNAAMWPGGSVYSSIRDLSRFVIALMDGGRLDGKQVLAPDVANRLLAAHVTLPGSDSASYGYGTLQYSTRGVRIVTHGGVSRGYGSTIQMVPEKKFAVIVVANRNGETLPDTRTRALERVLRLEPESASEPAPTRPAPIQNLADHVGVYAHAPQEWRVSIEGADLFLTRDGSKHRLVPAGPGTFSLQDRPGAMVAFQAGKSGRIEYLFDGLYAARKSDHLPIAYKWP